MTNTEVSLPVAETRDVAERRQRSLGLCLLASVLIGLLYTLLFMGPRVLNPRDIGWLTHDPIAHYVGWEQFRHDPKWRWPLTYTQWLGYPVGESAALQDFNPVLALVLKPFSAVLPEPFQYFGIEIVLSCALQFFFAWRLLRLFVGANIVGVLLASAFFLIAPPLTYRMHGHYSLTNHWVLLAALFLFFQVQFSSHLTLRKFVLWALALAALVVAINPYLTFEVLSVLTATVASLIWQNKLPFVRALAFMALLSVVCGLVAYSIGFVIIGGKGYATSGYRYFSMNLLSPIDPCLTRIEPHGRCSILLPRLPQLTDGQYEGYNYLGVGVILLATLTVALLLYKRRQLKLLDKRWVIPLLSCCLVLTLMACSTRISFGSHVLIDLDPHEKSTQLFAPLRASGRLFWLPYYLILTVVLVTFMLLVRKPWINLVLFVVLILQVADTGPLRRWVRTYINKGYSQPQSFVWMLPNEVHSFNNAYSQPLRSPIWWTLGSSYKNLVILPAWQCDNSNSPGGLDGYGIFGLLAADQKMRTNSYDSARYTERSFEFHCVQSITDLAERPLSPDTAYVVTPTLAAIIANGPTGPGKCHDLDGYILCSIKSDFGLSPSLKNAAERERDAIRDPGFEDDDLAAWPGFQNAKSFLSTDRARSGLHSLAQSEGEGSVNQDIGGLEPGRVYVVSAWVSASPGATARAQIALWSPSANIATFSPELHSTPEWQLLTLAMAAGADGILRLHLFRKEGSGTIYWDDLSIHREQ
jgi:hypothetical protein